MLIALRDRLRVDRQEDWPIPEQLENQFLRNQYAKGERRNKIQLRRRDDQTLQWLIDRQSNNERQPDNLSERVLENYADFRTRLEQEDPKLIYDGLLKLKLVHVILLRGQDDPQMIFESLNSTGMDLTPGDLVRNFVLMRQEEAVQTSLYNSRWRPIEDDFGNRYREKFDTFLNHYLILQTKQNKPIKQSDVYPQFKQYFIEASGIRTVDEELALMGQSAKHYVRYALGSETDPDLKNAFRKLLDLVDVAAPVVMKLYEYHDGQQLSKKDFIGAIELVESYVFRRSICGLQSRGLGSIMATFANKIKADDPLLRLKVALKTRPHNQRFPDDDEFLAALLTRDIYHTDNCKLLLERLENHGTKEPTLTRGYTIEHIMPQDEDLHKDWQDMLGADWQTIHQEWLHRLGNLTLTGYNTEYSNHPFSKKKTISGGFNESPLRLNKDMRDSLEWNKELMQKRAERLAAQALKEWPSLTVSDPDVQRIRLEELKERSSKYNRETLNLTEEAAILYDHLSEGLKGLGDDVVEVFHRKSATFRTLDYVVEVLPRAGRLVLLYNLEYADCDDPSEEAENMADRSFVVNAQETGGVLYKIHDIDEVQHALHIAAQAYRRLKSD